MDSGPTVFTKHVASVEDALLCFMSEEILNKILFYSNMERIVTRLLMTNGMILQ